MKCLILSLLLLSPQAFACSKDRPDLCKHLGVSFTIAMMMNYSGDSAHVRKQEVITTTILAVGALGIAKELTDEKFDLSDVAANTMGSILGTILYWEF